MVITMALVELVGLNKLFITGDIEIRILERIDFP